MRPPVDIEFALKSIVGTASPLLEVITSFQEQIEWHLRILSLLVGLAVGVLSLTGLWRKLRGGDEIASHQVAPPGRQGGLSRCL